MQAVAVVLASFALAATSAAVHASTCRRCDFGGLCRRGQALVQCLPSEGRCRPNGGIRANRVGFWGHQSNRGAPQTQIVEFLADGLVVSHIALEDWYLDTVETGLF